MHTIRNATKNYIQRNRKTIILGVSLSTVILLQGMGTRSLNKFLEEKGLFEEYYGFPPNA